MAQTYTYEDFEKALRASGLADQFSEDDLTLARTDPSAGMSILNYKTDWNNATTDELRALANAGANEVRANYYKNNSQNAGASTPGSFSYDAAVPKYKNTYGAELDDLTKEIMNQKEFSYNHATDPLYSSYKKTYTREGQRATEDVLGDAAAMTGGIPSSYAVSAAAQAGNQYAAALADKVPELYDMAYQKYLNEYKQKLDRYEMLKAKDDTEYARYLEEVAKYQTDKNFDYAKWLDELEAKNAEEEAMYNRAYDAAAVGDFSQLEALGIKPDYEYLASLNEKKSDETAAGDVGATGGIDAETLAVLKGYFPDGQVYSDEDWDYLVKTFGEDVIANAGFKKADTSKDMKQLAGISQTEGTMITNDVYDLLQLMEAGDADIKTTEDIKNVIYTIYPKYKGNVLFEDYLDRTIAGSRNAVKK